MQIDEKILIAIGVRKTHATLYLNPINETLQKYQINTHLRVCHFLAQVLHESAMLSTMQENLNYSAQGLLKVFPKRFTEQLAKAFGRKPQAIANRVYANRFGNGDEQSGDGFKYSGKGAIQITFKDNYAKLSKDTGFDYVSNPNLLTQVPHCITSAGWFWNDKKLNTFADKDNLLAITMRVNGGQNGINHRQELLTKAKNVIPKNTIPNNKQNGASNIT